MNRFIKIILIIMYCVISTSALAQKNEKILRLRGSVENSKDKLPVYGAHIINISRMMGAVSDFDGSFSINIENGDTLIFRALGYYNDTLIMPRALPNDTLRIMIRLKERTYQLPSVDILPFGTYTQFKDAFINFEHKERLVDLQLPPTLNYSIPSSGGGVVIQGPITFLYEQFSRRSRDFRKYEFHSRENLLFVNASKVVNYEIIKQLTELTDESEIDEFLKFCNISKEFIVSNQEYIVYETLRACYGEYLKKE